MAEISNNELNEELRNFFETKVFPIIVLLLLSPIIINLLYGSILLSSFFLIIPEIGFFGCYSLITHMIVVRRKLRSSSIILFGLAFALANEFIIQQTSVAPFAGILPQNMYGRIFGINLIYLIWALGFEVVFGVFIPIKLFDLIYPEKKEDPLFGLLGLLIVIIAFITSAYALWYSITQIAYPIANNSGPYVLNITTSFIVIDFIILLLLIGFFNKKTSAPSKKLENLPPKPVIGFSFFIITSSWFLILLFASDYFPSIPFENPLFFSGLLILVVLVATTYWPRSPFWTDLTTIISLSSSLLAIMIIGFVTNGISQIFDFLTKLFLDILAIILLYILYKNTEKRLKLGSSSRNKKRLRTKKVIKIDSKKTNNKV